MVPKASLPYSHKPAIKPYPEPHELSSCFPSYFIKIHIIVPSLPMSFKWPLSFIFPHQNHACIFLLRCMFRKPRLPHQSLFHHLNNISWEVKIMTSFVSFSSFLSPPPSWVQITSSAPYCQTSSAYVLPLMRETKFHTHIKQQVPICCNAWYVLTEKVMFGTDVNCLTILEP
jgi:hypothetical protein